MHFASLEKNMKKDTRKCLTQLLPVSLTGPTGDKLKRVQTNQTTDHIYAKYKSK